MDVASLMADLQSIHSNYCSFGSIEALEADVLTLCEKYRDCFGVGDLLIGLGERFYERGDTKAGYILIRSADTAFGKLIANTTGAYLRIAEHFFEFGDTEKGTQYLVKLCHSVDNYEESIENSGLSHIWEKYKHHTEGKVSQSMKLSAPAPQLPSECSMQIDEIFALPRDQILTELSTHISELSGSGSCPDTLNRWEKIFFYIDELCTEVNSGGFEHYLYYCGDHANDVYAALEAIGASEVTALIDSITQSFTRKKLPTNIEKLQDAIDKLSDKGVSFDSQDEIYYCQAEKQLLDKLTAFVLENRHSFR